MALQEEPSLPWQICLGLSFWHYGNPSGICGWRKVYLPLQQSISGDPVAVGEFLGGKHRRQGLVRSLGWDPSYSERMAQLELTICHLGVCFIGIFFSLIV